MSFDSRAAVILCLLLLLGIPELLHAQQDLAIRVNVTATGVKALDSEDRQYRRGISADLEQRSGNDIQRYGIGYTSESDYAPGLTYARTGFGAYRTFGVLTAGVRLDVGGLHMRADDMLDTYAACVPPTCTLREPGYETGWALLLNAAAELRVRIAQRLELIGTFGSHSLVVGANQDESMWVVAGGIAYRF